MPPKDEYGVEYSESVENAMKDPKAATLLEVLDYRDRRQAAKIEHDKKEAEKNKKETSIFPW